MTTNTPPKPQANDIGRTSSPISADDLQRALAAARAQWERERAEEAINAASAPAATQAASPAPAPAVDKAQAASSTKESPTPVAAPCHPERSAQATVTSAADPANKNAHAALCTGTLATPLVTPSPPEKGSTQAPAHVVASDPPEEKDRAALPDQDEPAQTKPQAGKEQAKEQPDAQGIMHRFVLDCALALDKGNGLLFAAMMRGQYTYVPEQKQWLRWGGTAWGEAFDYEVYAAVERIANRYVQAKAVEDYTFRDEMRDAETNENGEKKMSRAASAARRHAGIIARAIDNLHKKQGVKSCVEFALCNDKPLAVSADALNADPYLVACADGVVDLRTGSLRQGKPSDNITRVVPSGWESIDTPCPLWEQMLFTILGESQEVYEYFHKILGMALCGKITEKIFIVMLGEDGNSGKTTIFEIILRILRGYVSPMQVEMLLDQKNPRDPNSPTPSIMAMRGQRICWASEPGENRRFSVEQVKLFSGNDSLVGRYPWDKTNTAFEPSHTLFLLTNHKMRAASNDTPFWERLRLVNCPFSFVDNPQGEFQRKIDRSLMDRIVEQEAAGVFAWFVRGYQKYIVEGLHTPESVKRDTEAYRREEDLILQFMEACLERDEGRRVSSADVYQCFKAWFIDTLGKNAPSATTFGKLAPRHLRKDKIGGKVWYYDIAFNDDARGKYASGL